MKNQASNIISETLLITGAAGSIGRELVKGFATQSMQRIILVDLSETGLHSLLEELNIQFPEVSVSYYVASICDTYFLKFLFETYKITTVIHAAAYKHVSLMEENSCAAITTNTFGAQLLIDFSIEHNVIRFLTISTDKAVNPINTMGRTKKVVEDYIQFKINQKPNTALIVLRLCNVFGSVGSVVPVFKNRIEKKLPLIIKDKNLVRYFIVINSVFEMCNWLISEQKNSGFFIPKNYEKTTITAVASRVLQNLNENPENYPIQFTKLPSNEKLEEDMFSSFENVIEIENAPLNRVVKNEFKTFDFQLMQKCIVNAMHYNVREANKLLVQLTSG